ncbi:hypothetical protein [Bdellovibrio sp. HCB2-146]|uniref:hypothetical protein n=1 Tax=Bdellovibrio sp. HCB2-146 TaxID=3394362 RepID=UPI0039BD795B
MKSLMMILLTLVSSTTFAGVRYDCITNGVPLFSSQGKQISDQRQSEVRYEVRGSENGNLVVGDHDFIIWHKTESVAILAKGQEGMLLRRVLPLDKPVEVQLDVNYLGQRKQVRCEIRNI